jgi:hypothetical protein
MRMLHNRQSPPAALLEKQSLTGTWRSPSKAPGAREEVACAACGIEQGRRPCQDRLLVLLPPRRCRRAGCRGCRRACAAW